MGQLVDLLTHQYPQDTIDDSFLILSYYFKSKDSKASQNYPLFLKLNTIENHKKLQMSSLFLHFLFLIHEKMINMTNSKASFIAYLFFSSSFLL